MSERHEGIKKQTVNDQSRATVLGVLRAHPHGCFIHASEITAKTGVDGVGIRSIVNEARRAGTPVCSCDKGYSWGTHPSHLSETIEHIQGRISALEAVLEGLHTAQKNLFNHLPGPADDIEIDLNELLSQA